VRWLEEGADLAVSYGGGMPDTDPPPPPIGVTLPDGQQLMGVLHERRCWPLGGWMYLVGLPMWATVSATEEVEAREYRVWLTPDHIERPEGVSYDGVPTFALPQEDQDDDSGSR
jgi:hypothetical protein